MQLCYCMYNVYCIIRPDAKYSPCLHKLVLCRGLTDFNKIIIFEISIFFLLKKSKFSIEKPFNSPWILK